MERLTANINGQVRRESLNGREYLVAPLSLIVPGVLPGSQGPLYYPQDEVAKNPSSWDKMPLLAYHPQSPTGEHVSANHAGIVDKQGIGFVQKSHIDPMRKSLRGEGWFDVERTKQVDKRILENLQANKPIELSTGLFIGRRDPAPPGANHNGQGYEWVARDYRPDHVAILPDQIGACSIRDGCGVLVNQLVFNNKSILKSGDRFEVVEIGGETLYRLLNSNPEGHNQYTGSDGYQSTQADRQKDQARIDTLESEVNAARKSAIAALRQHGKDSDDFKSANDSMQKAWEDHAQALSDYSAKHGKLRADERDPTYTSGVMGGGKSQRTDNYVAGQSPNPQAQAAAVAQAQSGGGFQGGGAGTVPGEEEEGDGGKKAKGEGAENQQILTANTWSDAAREAAIEARRANAKEPDSFKQIGQRGASNAAVTASKKAGEVGTKEAHYQAAQQHYAAADMYRKSGFNKAADAHEAAAKEHEDAVWAHEHLTPQPSLKTASAPRTLGDKIKSALHMNVDTGSTNGTGAEKPGIVKPPKAGSAEAKSDEEEYADRLRSTTANQESSTEATANELNSFLLYNAKWDQGARDKLSKEAPEDFAGPHQSFPIRSQEDVDHAARLIGHADDPEAVKSKVKAIAKRKGLSLPDSWKDEPTGNTQTKPEEAPMTLKELDDIIANCKCETTKPILVAHRQKLTANSPMKSPENMSDGELKDCHKRVVTEVAKRHAGIDDDVQDGADAGYSDPDEGSEVANDTEMHSFDGPKGSGKSDQAGGAGTKGEYPKPAQNAAAINRWLQESKAPPEIRELIGNARRIDNEAKLALVRRMVQNVANDKARNALGNRLMGKSLPELRELSLLAASSQEQFVSPEVPIYYGANPAFNQQGAQEVPVENEFVTPALNFKDMASPHLVKKLEESFGKQ